MGQTQILDRDDLISLNRNFVSLNERGLDDKVRGDHFSFIDTVIQLLWHVSSFSTVVIESEAPSYTTLGILRDIFIEFKYSDYSTVSPDILNSLFTSISTEFNKNNSKDAIELFSLILNRIHDENDSNACTEMNKCIAHQSFSGSLPSGVFCKICNDIHSRIMIPDFLHIIYSHEIIEFTSRHPNASIATLMNGGYNSILSEIPCPNSSCHEKARIILANSESICPPAVAVSIAWASTHESFDMRYDFYSLIPIQLTSKDIFVAPSSPKDIYQFKGMICYYEEHYIAIFQDFSMSNAPQFIIFENSHIHKVGSWTDAKDMCIRAGYIPILLVYEHDEWGVLASAARI